MSDNENKDYGPRKALVNASVDWPRLRLSEQVKHLRFFRDAENNIVVFAVMPFDSTQPGVDVLPIGKVGVADPIINASYARCFGHPCVGWPETTVGLVTHSTMMLQNCLQLEAQRTPSSFHDLQTGAGGANIVWNPAAGTRFHLMGFVISLGIGSTCAGAFYIRVMDAAGLIARIDISPGALAATTHVWSQAYTFPGNGYPSAVIDNDLILNLNANLTAGVVNITAWGYEE